MRGTAKGCFSGYHHRGGGRVVMADFSGSGIDIPSFPRMRMGVSAPPPRAAPASDGPRLRRAVSNWRGLLTYPSGASDSRKITQHRS
jgi:hypothetical protein